MTVSVIGQPLARVDGPRKATGTAKYVADFAPAEIAHAFMLQSTVASGRIAAIDVQRATAMRGVLLVLTHLNAPVLPARGILADELRALSLLQNDEVHYNGQPIGVVIAEEWEQAVAAAACIEVSYRRESAELDFSHAKLTAAAPEDDHDRSWGNVDEGVAAADIRIDRVYTTPMEHHNPLEPHATVAQWEGDHLTLHDSTQYISGVRDTVAKALGIEPHQVRVVCPFVGGGFGCKGETWSHVVLAAMAAREVGRPVKLVLAREQMFGPVGGRPQTEQRIVLAARRDGRLSGIRHEVISHTSTLHEYVEPSTHPTRALYGYPHGAVTQRIAKLHVGVPTYQRAPGESTGTFAVESAMDELAETIGMDPVALRLRNHAEVEPATGKRWSSKRLRECYAVASERFGWSNRTPSPRSMRDGDWLVGYGMATATYPASRESAAASARALRDGTVVVRSGTQDLGTGTYTIMTQIAAETLGLPVEAVRAELGDTSLPEAPISGGSMTAASVGPAVQSACASLRKALIRLATRDRASPLHGADPRSVSLVDGRIAARDRRGEPLAALLARQPRDLEAKAKSDADDGRKLAYRSFGAVFAEVQVHESLIALRVPRIVAAYSVGRVLNAKTAASQLQGGIVWGIGMALHEQSVLHLDCGRFVNGNLSEYHVPVNADVGTIETLVVDETDHAFNSLGARGIGEIGITGVAAALANAVYHAIGRRIRDLPITLDKLL